MWKSNLETIRLYRPSIIFGGALFISLLFANLHTTAELSLNPTTLLKTGAIAALFIGAVWNHSSLCRKEQTLRRRLKILERRVQSLVQNTTNAVITFDEQRRIDLWNPQAEKLFGLSQNEARGEDVVKILFSDSEEHTENCRETFLRLLKEYRPDEGAQRLTQEEQILFPRKNDGNLTLEYSLIATPEEQGRLRFVLLLQDLSEREELQLRMIQMDRLAAVGTLAAGVVHEINNPLTYIASSVAFVDECLERLNSSAENDLAQELQKTFQKHLIEAKKWLETIDEGTRRIHKIVRDMQIYFYSHSSSKEHPVPIQEVLDLAVRMTRGQVKKTAQMKVEISTKAQVRSDQTRLSQVFVNLIVNAMHAMEPIRGRNHRLKICAFDEDNRVVITFTDTGQGMTREIQRRIFSPFFTTKPMGTGTGLGLSLSQAIVEQSGGKIVVDSRHGEGSTFRVELPALK